MYKRLSTFDYIIISLLSCGFVCLIYHLLYDKIGYTNLNYFYVGNSIYKNHNKILDLAMFPLYVALFFIFVPIFKILPKINFKFELPDINFDIQPFIKSHKRFCMVIQTILSFGYIILHPFDGNFYPILASLIIFFIILSIVTSYINLYKKENAELSIYALIPIFILLFGNGYNFENGIIEVHHEGEKAAVWLMHHNFNIAYYKDVMMVHGFSDILPPLFGYYVFKDISANAFLLGRSLFDNLILIATVIFSYYIFKKSPILISFSMFRAFNMPQLYILSFFVFLKSAFKQNFYFWIFLYIIFAYFATFFWTTYGLFWLIASLPLALYICIKNQNKSLKIFFTVILLFVILFFNKDFIFSYMHEAANYIESNLYAFGNDFANLKWHQIISDYIKLFALIATPFFIIKLFEELNSPNKNLNYIFTLIFAILFVITSINYSLGRIDYITMQRIRDISLSYLGILVPYLLLIKNNKIIKYFNYLAVIMAIYLIFTHVPQLSKWKTIPLPEQKNIKDIGNIINTYSKTDNDFLDINHGMNYFYFNKKMPIPYTSYFNVVNSKQNKQIAEIKPNVILLETDLPRFDNVYPSLRINELYRNLLLNSDYSTLSVGKNLFLIKKKGEKDLYKLDKALSTKDLGYLTDAWFNSKTHLPIEKLDIKYSIKGNFIEFDKPQNGKNIDLIELNTDSKNINYTVSINGSKSELNFKSRQNSVLLPFDNFPSWLLNKNIKTITINSDKPLKIKLVHFYKRK